MNKKTTFFLICPFLNFRNCLLAILIICISNCKSDTANQTECLEKKLDVNCCPQIDSTIKQLPKPNISTLNIFLETSGSMKGYMPSDTLITNFQTLIPEILSKLNTEFPQRVRFYSIHSSTAAFENLDLSTARRKVQKGDFKWTGSTYVPVMLDSIFKGYLKENVVNVFISDCIYSPEADDAKDVRLTQTDIRDKMKRYSANFSTTTFCLTSQFRNKNSALVINSPYYLILMGEPQNIYEVKDLIANSLSSYSPNTYEINFGLKYPKSYYSVLPYTETSGNFIPFPCDSFQNAYISIQDISLGVENDSIQFWVGFDLKALPSYTKEIEYLDSNLTLGIENGVGEIVSILNKPPISIVSDDKTISEKCTHFIQIKITKLEGHVSALNLSLKYSRPQWVSLMHESQDEKNRLKTFNLGELISGFEQAYNQEYSAFFLKNYRIALLKK